jgi:peptide/nickel transport system substrate-binding protein
MTMPLRFRWKRHTLLALAAVVLWSGFALGVAAQELRIGLSSEPNSIDPLYFNSAANASLAKHIFDRLVHQDKRQRLIPGIAVSWRPTGDDTWEFKLRPGVLFHDGTPLTADDVAFSLERVNAMASLSNFGLYTKEVRGIEVVDAATIRIRTDGSYPLLPEDLSAIAIQSRHAAEGKVTEDFNRGEAAIGTGPYRFVEWVRGGRIVLRRNDRYWGPRSDWETVILKPIVNNGSRTAALLAGDVDVIEDVPTADIPRLESDPNVTLAQAVSSRMLYLTVDVARDRPSFVADRDGAPLSRNPMKDLRLRRAISMAIDRDALCKRVMGGAALPAGQLVPEGFFGATPRLVPQAFDPEGAARLLAEAGYPQGFQITLNGPQGRWPNDEKVVQAVAQMLAHIGIDAKVVTMPGSIYVSRTRAGELSFALGAWAVDTGEASSAIRGVLATYDPAKVRGSGNFGRYSNPEIDSLLAEAMHALDRDRREALLQHATELGIADLGVIPLYFQLSTWASRKGITVEGGAFPQTLAIDIHAARAP